MTSLQDALTARGFLLADGATGTTLFNMGLQAGDAPELWNESRASDIFALHQSFIEAGSDIILTNSFGGNQWRLSLHGCEAQVGKLNLLAAQHARKMADQAPRPVLVAGSIGPSGELFEPLGTLAIETAAQGFYDQAAALAAGGVDILWIETMSSSEEVQAALLGAGKLGLPMVCTLSFDTHGSTMMGLRADQLVTLLQAHMQPTRLYGANCGLGPAETVCGVLNLARSAPAGDILVAKGNCGIPEYADGVIHYGGTPELMGKYATLAYDAGARIIGGCCGTSAEHVRAMREALDAHTPGAKPDVQSITDSLGAITTGALAQLEGKLNTESIAVSRRVKRRRGGSDDSA